MRDLLEITVALLIAAVLGLLLPACATNAYDGLLVKQIHTNTLNTQQPCLKDKDALKLADVAAVLYLEAAARAKLIDYEEGAESLRSSRPYVCLIEQLEPCRIGKVCSLGSDGQGGYKPDCAPKVGCAGVAWAWAAKDGPNWRSDLVHEIGHALALRWAIHQSPDHQDAWAGVEAQVQGKLRAAGLIGGAE